MVLSEDLSLEEKLDNLVKSFMVEHSIESDLNSAINYAKDGNVVELENSVKDIYASMTKIEFKEDYSIIKEKIEDLLLRTRYSCYQNCVMNKILAFKKGNKQLDLPRKISVKEITKKEITNDENLTNEESLAINFLYGLQIKLNSASLAKTITTAMKYTEEKNDAIRLYPRIVQIIGTAKKCSKILGLEREMSPIISAIEKKYDPKYFQAKTR